jgi:RimJ/RimL family protein N-acetyltransferase
MSSALLPTSPRLTFRQMRGDDLDDLHRLLGDPVVMAHYPRPRTREEAMAWIRWNQDNYARDGFGLWVVHERGGSFVGDCGLTWQVVDEEEQLEIGYHVVPEHQRKGLATEAATACRELARSRGIAHLVSIIRPDNVASHRVAEKVGMVLERRTVHRSGLPVDVLGMRLDPEGTAG